MDLRDRFSGCLLGLALGDALGYPVEFMNRSEITARFGPDGITDLVVDPQAGVALYSDDTQMTVAVARALIAADLDDLDDIMRHVSSEFSAWARSPENDRAPGPTCVEGALRLGCGVHWFSSGDPYSKGCGAAMRVAPIGLLLGHEPERMLEVVRAVSICTHAHPTGISSAIAAARAVSYACCGGPLDDLLPAIARSLERRRGRPPHEEVVSHDPLGEQLRALATVPAALAAREDAAWDLLGGGWVGEEAVAGALYAFLRSPDDLRATLTRAANAAMTDESARGGGKCDSDSIACIAGSIAGAYLGAGAIPPDWIARLENAQMVRELADALLAKVRPSRITG